MNHKIFQTYKLVRRFNFLWMIRQTSKNKFTIFEESVDLFCSMFWSYCDSFCVILVIAFVFSQVIRYICKSLFCNFLKNKFLIFSKTIFLILKFVLLILDFYWVYLFLKENLYNSYTYYIQYLKNLKKKLIIFNTLRVFQMRIHKLKTVR